MTTSSEIMHEIRQALDDLKAEKISVEEARARAGLLKSASKMADTMLAHAKLTGRLAQGSDELPGFTMGGSGKTRK